MMNYFGRFGVWYQNLHEPNQTPMTDASADEFERLKAKEQKGREIICDLLISVSKADRLEARQRVKNESIRLGNWGFSKYGTSTVWEVGQALEDIYSHHEKAPYGLEKRKLIRELKHIQDEDRSRFNKFQILNQRYLLLNLLGKGGFSEVFKGFDLAEYRYVACKMHVVDPNYPEDLKRYHLRRVEREKTIQEMANHKHILQHFDMFEIDQNSSCAVLEYCSGNDLEAMLNARHVLQESEAKLIIGQVIQGLVYLNQGPRKVIHYDLKPANILFDESGVAKISDFGLSKIVEGYVGPHGIELTTPGAGTFRYLAPECHDKNRIPRISSKVDVWAVGTIFYKMLFGKLPFGDGQNMNQLLLQDTMLNARQVYFPATPPISIEAQEFIKKCMRFDQGARPDVLEIARDPYLGLRLESRLHGRENIYVNNTPYLSRDHISIVIDSE